MNHVLKSNTFFTRLGNCSKQAATLHV